MNPRFFEFPSTIFSRTFFLSSSCRKAISRENTTGEEHKQTRSQDRFCLCSQDRVCLCSSCGVSYEGQCGDRRRAAPPTCRCSAARRRMAHYVGARGQAGCWLALVCVFITAGPNTKLFAWGGGILEDMCYERRRAEDAPRCKFYSTWQSWSVM